MTSARHLLLASLVLCSTDLVVSRPVAGQEPYFKSSVGLSYTSLRADAGDQYLGFGVEYRYMPRPWLGLQAQASQFPYWQTSITSSQPLGRAIGQASLSVLTGHRWGRFGLYAENGIGYLRPAVLGFGPIPWTFQNYLDVQMGGLLDVSLGRRWSLTYEVRDNLALMREKEMLQSSLNIPEGRVGVAFHFQPSGATPMRQTVVRPPMDKEKPLKNSIGVSYTTLRWSRIANYASQQWLGAGLEYQFMPVSWAGVELHGGYSPQTQALLDTVAGGRIVQADASGLLGHRWGRVGVFGEAGFGVVRTKVFAALPPQSSAVFAWRDYPAVPVGGTVDLSLGRRWSVNFKVRDNITFIGPFYFYGPIFGSRPTTYGFFPPSSAFVDNVLDTRAGVAFHF
jgi:hypothetical protein